MKLVLDMNLPPAWCALLSRHGHDVVHWSDEGDAKAFDRAIMDWAEVNGRVVVTYDLDFGALLASTNALGPSVVLVRAGDVLAPQVEALVAAALVACADDLENGAIVTVLTGDASIRDRRHNRGPPVLQPVPSRCSRSASGRAFRFPALNFLFLGAGTKQVEHSEG